MIEQNKIVLKRNFEKIFVSHFSSLADLLLNEQFLKKFKIDRTIDMQP